jgi:hypothetical protein
MAAIQKSSERLGAWLVSEQSSPSQRVQRNEEAVRVAEALAELPEDNREALIQHYCESLPLSEVANRMGRTTSSVAGLLKRGLKRLRELIQETGWRMPDERIDEVIAEFLEAKASGQPPDRAQFLLRHTVDSADMSARHGSARKYGRRSGSQQAGKQCCSAHR